MIDIVFPRNNEEKFVEIAENLDYNSLLFLYPLADFNKGKEGRSLGDALNRIREKSPPPPPPKACTEHNWAMRYTKANDCFSDVCRVCGAKRVRFLGRNFF